MKLVTYRLSGAEYVGALTADGKGVLPLPAADMNTLIETMTLADLRSAAAAAERGGAVPLSEVELLVSEAGKPDGVIPRHAGLTDRLDYEAELAVVLGKAARDVKAADAADYIFGYTVLNDVSARDLQTGHKQWYFGKSLDGFTPMGPVLVTADEIAYPPALEITSRVNGELRQKSNTALLITSIGQILEELTGGMTLLPGTIIATGTPAGVGMGFDPPRFLQSGDTVECAIEGIGTLCSTVI